MENWNEAPGNRQQTEENNRLYTEKEQLRAKVEKLENDIDLVRELCRRIVNEPSAVKRAILLGKLGGQNQ